MKTGIRTLIVLSIVLLSIMSCQNNDRVKPTNVIPEITYFKDPRTGLCFASVNSLTTYGYKVTSITCVPCASLAKIGIK